MKIHSAVLTALLVPSVIGQQFGPEQTVWSGFGQAWGVDTADLDGDGDQDVVSCSRSGNWISWHENLGSGGFGPRRQISVTASSRVWSAHAADVNGDGLIDVLACRPDENKVLVHYNGGNGTFSGEQVISSALAQPVAVVTGDIDGDGDLDIVSASNSGLAWHERTHGTNWANRVLLAAPAGGVEYAACADLDADGDLDIVSSSSMGIVFHENLGGGTFGPSAVLDATVTQAGDLDLSDLDGDGELDVVSASSMGARWNQNLGGGAFGTSQVLAHDSLLAYSVHALDFDLDGDTDVVSASPALNQIVFVENVGLGVFAAPEVIASNASGIRWVTSADLDGDGDPDLVATMASVSWFENFTLPDCNGNGVPDHNEIASGARGDCDGDGILDECEIAAGLAQDCNGNGVPDTCELAQGMATDCDGDGTLDECQLAMDATFDLDGNGIFDSCEALGSNYCGPAVTNSTGAGASLTALGSELIFFNDVTLTARGLPQNSFGMFVASQTPGYAFPIPNSEGALCVLGLVGRYNQPGQIIGSGATGSLFFPIDVLAIPTPTGFAQALPGETWNFQAWYRDSNPTGNTSNFTDAVSITFQ